RHVTELASAAAAAHGALAPEDGDGAAALVAHAEQALGDVERLAPELARHAEELRDVEVRLREAASDLASFAASLEAEPGRLEEVEAELDRIAEAKRRFRAGSYEELRTRAAEARAELEGLEEGLDPLEAAERALATAEERRRRLAEELRSARRDAAGPFADAVAAELQDIGLHGGECRGEPAEPEPAPAGSDRVSFLVRANAGLPFAPVAETASGGELSRIALAIAAVG